MNKKIFPFIFVIVSLLAISLVSATITGSETMTRTAGTANPSSTFTLTYTALSTSGTWGASIQDAVTGGCKFPDGTTSYKTVMLSTDGSTKSISITTPSSGSCVFTGDYQFGTSPTVSFSSLTVNLGGASCTPDNSCAANTCTGSTCTNNCGDSLTGTKSCGGNTCTDSTWTPDTSTVCSGTAFTQTSNCANTRSSTGTKSCGGSTQLTCSPAIPKFDFIGLNSLFGLNDPCISGYLGIALIIIGVIVIISLLK